MLPLSLKEVINLKLQGMLALNLNAMEKVKLLLYNPIDRLDFPA